jgi:hypothetical protein
LNPADLKGQRFPTPILKQHRVMLPPTNRSRPTLNIGIFQFVKTAAGRDY